MHQHVVHRRSCYLEAKEGRAANSTLTSVSSSLHVVLWQLHQSDYSVADDILLVPMFPRTHSTSASPCYEHSYKLLFVAYKLSVPCVDH
uniref:Uncharacterized protein n=1 Tax=Arundo donax TaxID=35708 RepID=A0A0A9GSK7_ARUDO